MKKFTDKFTFGKFKGVPIKDCPLSYLRWVANTMWNTNFHEWSVVAKEYLESDEVKEEKQVSNLEDAADRFLRAHGVNPNDLYLSRYFS